MGLATAAARVAGMPTSPVLWLGTAILSCAPDLDFLGVVFGLSARQAHRKATHSTVVLSGLIAAAGWVWTLLPSGVELRLGLAWAAALLSHPVLDVLTTGPKIDDTQVGIPLLWPVTSSRWFLLRAIVATDPLMEVQPLRGVRNVLLAEIYVLGPLLMALLLIDYLVLRGM